MYACRHRNEEIKERHCRIYTRGARLVRKFGRRAAIPATFAELMARDGNRLMIVGRNDDAGIGAEECIYIHCRNEKSKKP